MTNINKSLLKGNCLNTIKVNDEQAYRAFILKHIPT